MKKSDLKDGMVVETRGGSKYLIRTLENGNKVLSAMEKWLMLDDGYHEDLTDDTFKDLDIVKVFKTNGLCFNTVFEERNLTLIWQEEREIDWSKVPKWTPVEVKDTSEGGWSNNYFIKYDESQRGLFTGNYITTNCDIFTYEPNKVTRWIFCRIHPDVEIKEEWYK